MAPNDLDMRPGNALVPIIVWRIASPHPPSRLPGGSGLRPALAALLIRFYTGPGDTVLDLTSDPAVAGAAGAGGCRYLPIDHPAALAGLDHLAGTVRLVVLRWPPTVGPADSHADDEDDTDPTAGADPTGLLAACRPLLAIDGYTVVALIPVPPHSYYIDHVRRLLPAAHRAGLGYLEHILAVSTPLTGHPGPRPAAHADQATTPGTAANPPFIDLLVFVLRPPGPAAEPTR